MSLTTLVVTSTSPLIFLLGMGQSIIIIIIIKDIYITQVRKGHKCAMSAEMAVWLLNCLCLCSYLTRRLIADATSLKTREIDTGLTASLTRLARQ